MAGSAFDLDQFAPAAVAFTVTENKLKKTYLLDGDPDVDVVARMLRIEDEISEASKTGETDAIVASVREGKKMIVELMMAADVDQDVSALKLNSQQVLSLFALVLHGPSVAAAVAQAIARPTSEGGDDENAVATPPGDHGEDAADTDAAPLASASTSPEPPSPSEETDAGLLVTGTA